MTSMHFYESEGDFDAADDRQLYPPPHKKRRRKGKIKEKTIDVYSLAPAYMVFEGAGCVSFVVSPSCPCFTLLTPKSIRD